MPVPQSVLVPAFSRLVAASICGDIGERSREQIEALLGEAAHVQGLVDAVRLAATRRLESIADSTGSLDPAQVVALAGRTSRREAAQTVRRSRVTGSIPQLGDSLAAGCLSVNHLDAVSNALARLEPDQRRLLEAEGEWIAGVAARSTPDELARALALRVRQLSIDDGLSRFERQRRATTLRHWTDPPSGMVCFYGELDPENGARLITVVAQGVERLFHDAVPPTCPTDERKPGHLRALALIDLVINRSSPTVAPAASPNGASPLRAPPSDPRWRPRSEMLVVIDHETLLTGMHARSRLEVSGEVELPLDTIRRLACTADIIPVVLNGDGVALDVGRSRRLATTAQRRALRAMYPHCAVHSCNVVFEHCDPHHVRFWRDGGASDLVNLVPLCSRHHHCAHEGGWQLTVRPDDRVLLITLPDGTSFANPPPFARAG